MALVQMATQSWGWVTDTQGNGLPSATVTITNLDGSAATHYADLSRGSPLTSALTTNADGTLPRYLDGGTYNMAVNGGTSRRIDAVSGGIGWITTAPTDGTDATAALRSDHALAFAGAGSLLRGIKFRQTAVNRDTSANPLVRFDIARAGAIEACEFNDADVPGIELRHCFDFDIDRPKFSNLIDDIANDRIGYGVNLHGNCRDILITKPRARWVRHAVTTNGDDFGAPRHVLVTHGQGYESSGGSWNTHKEGKFITFAFCESHNDKGTGFFIRSPYTALIEPRVIRPGGDGIAYAQSECDNGHIVGGYALGSGGSGFYPLNLTGRNIKVDGTFVEGAASGQPNVKCFALEAKLHNLHSKNPGTSVHVDFPTGAGSDGVVQGGWFQNTSRPRSSVSRRASRSA
jgi:hypothetical protein